MYCMLLIYHECVYNFRYTGHRNKDYKLDSVLSHTDGHVVSGSEDGRIFFWDLVEVGTYLLLLATFLLVSVVISDLPVGICCC